MAEMDFGRGERALCALHPEQTASRTCARCGNFMCDTCGQGGTQALCPTCREREGRGDAFPLGRDTWTVGALVDTCWEAFKREWVMLCVGVLLVVAASFVGQIVSQVLSVVGGLVDSFAITVLFLFLGYLASTVVQGVVSLGFLRMLFDVLEGRKADVGRVFSQLHKAVPYLLTLLLMFLLLLPLFLLMLVAALGAAAATGGLEALESVNWTALVEGAGGEEAARGASALLPTLWWMLLVAGLVYLFPGLWLLTPLLLVQPELAYTERPTAVDTLRRCFAYARGQRLGMVGTALLGFVLIIAGILACCVGVVPATGFFNLLVAGLYLSLRTGAGDAEA
jgi:hypothetical protein